MSLALTIAMCLRDDESQLADVANAARVVAETLVREHAAGEWSDPSLGARPDTREKAIRAHRSPADAVPSRDALVTGSVHAGDLDFELLALDESSRDNTLSALSILHSKVPQLRTIQQLEPGAAIRRAAREAAGRVWLLVDAPFDPEHGLWATRQVFCGQPAALVPGEVLAVRRNVGQSALGWHRGGLVGAQRDVERMLARHGQRAAWSPPRDRALSNQLRLFVRGRLGAVGLGRFDRQS
jgi:hypothetical protein